MLMEATSVPSLTWKKNTLPFLPRPDRGQWFLGATACLILSDSRAHLRAGTVFVPLLSMRVLCQYSAPPAGRSPGRTTHTAPFPLQFLEAHLGPAVNPDGGHCHCSGLSELFSKVYFVLVFIVENITAVSLYPPSLSSEVFKVLVERTVVQC